MHCHRIPVTESPNPPISWSSDALRQRARPRDAGAAAGLTRKGGPYARCSRTPIVSGCGRRATISFGTICQNRPISRGQSISSRSA